VQVKVVGLGRVCSSRRLAETPIFVLGGEVGVVDTGGGCRHGVYVWDTYFFVCRYY
jgi:hypothetical protein